MNNAFVYKPVLKLDILSNRHKLVNKLNKVALITIIVVGVVGIIVNYLVRMLGEPVGLYILYILSGVLNCAIYIYLHELTHAFAIILMKGKTPTIKFGKLVAWCGSPVISFNKAQYAFVASFPFVLYCALLIPLIVLLPAVYFPIMFFPLCYNVFGSMGDIYMIFVMMKAPKKCMIIDEGTEVCAYMPIDAQ